MVSNPFVESKLAPIPRFKIRETIGELTVRKYYGHGHEVPEGWFRSKPQHWYGLQCSCGNEMVLPQDSLVNARIDCDDCRKERRNASVRRSRSNSDYKAPPQELNFATMRLTAG